MSAPSLKNSNTDLCQAPLEASTTSKTPPALDDQLSDFEMFQQYCLEPGQDKVAGDLWPDAPLLGSSALLSVGGLGCTW